MVGGGPAVAQFTVTDIPDATRDVNADGIPDDPCNTLYRVRGRITSRNFVRSSWDFGSICGGIPPYPIHTDGFEMFIQDPSVAGGLNAGVLILFAAPTPAEDPGFDPAIYQIGREVEVTGDIRQVDGVTTMFPAIPSLRFTVTEPNPVPVVPTVKAIATLLASPEDYESTLVRVNGVSFTGSPTLPDLGSSASISVSDGTGTLTMRIDEDTDIPGQLPPSGSFDLVGIFTQFDNSAPFTSGYQVLPRFYSDFVRSSANVAPQLVLPPAGVIVGRPGQEVELTVLAQDLNTNDTLTITAPGAPAGSTFTTDPRNSRLATFRWTPGPADAGSTTGLTFMVNDGTTSAFDPYDLVVLTENLSNVLIHEVLYDPPSGVPTGDANGDGTRSSSEDEFIEIYNAGASPIDLSGWTLELDTGTLFTFPVATVLAPEMAVVVFGGGSPTGAFGGAQVFSAGGWSPVLSNSGSGGPIRLRTGGGVTVDSLDYSGFSDNPDASLTRDTDGTFSAFVEHDSLGALLFSPGTKNGGTPFDGAGVTNTPPVVDAVDDLVVRIGETVYVSVSASDVDGNPLTLSVANEPASGGFTDHGNGTATLAYTGVVTDAGMSFPLEFTADDGTDTDTWNATLDVPTLQYSGLIINELLPDPDVGATQIDSNNDGSYNSSHDEFIEIVNLTQGSLDLGGCTLSDAFSTRHTFTPLVLPQGGSVVVFGGGSLTSFTASPAQVASSGTLGLTNSGDTVTLKDPAGNPLDVVRYADPGVPDGASLNRDPDLSFGPFSTHTGLAGTIGPTSPGTRFDGTPFLSDLPPEIVVTGLPAVRAGETMVLTAVATDVDGEDITLSISQPPNATVMVDNTSGPADGTFTFTPDATQVGTVEVTFSATDSGGTTDEVVSVTVLPAAPNCWTFETQGQGWSVEDQGGDLTWSLLNDPGNDPNGTDHYWEINGFSADAPMDDWLISPALDFTGVDLPAVVFFGMIKFAGTPTNLTLQISSDYTGSGDPGLATWTEFTIPVPGAPDAWTEIPIILSGFGNLGGVHLAFRYRSDGPGSSQYRWRVDEVKVLTDNDSDGDGATDVDELLADTDRFDPGDVLRITAIERSGTDINLTVSTKATRNYAIQFTTDPSDPGNWQDLAPAMPGNGGEMVFTDANPPGLLRLYRALASLP